MRSRDDACQLTVSLSILQAVRWCLIQLLPEYASAHATQIPVSRQNVRSLAMAAVRAARRQSATGRGATELTAPPPLERTLAKFVDVLGAINDERRYELRTL